MSSYYVYYFSEINRERKIRRKDKFGREELTKRVIRRRSKNNIHSRTNYSLLSPSFHTPGRKRKERKERVISSSYTGNDSLSTGQHSPRAKSAESPLPLSFHNAILVSQQRAFQNVPRFPTISAPFASSSLGQD